MTANDVVLVVVLVVSLASIAMLAILAGQLRRAVAELRDVSSEFVERAAPALDELIRAARSAGGQVDRLDDLISTAASVTETMDSATAATVRVLSSPVIKTAALAKGTKRAARRLRRIDGGR